MHKRPVKKCTCCKKPRLETSFYPLKRGGVRAVCKQCMKARQRRQDTVWQEAEIARLVDRQITHLHELRGETDG